MFVNDIYIPSIVSSPVFMFDDTKIFHVIKSSNGYKSFQNDLNTLYKSSLIYLAAEINS